MKTFKKLRLINWHSFYNETIEAKTVNVITGENGTGKSTILDAIYYVLSGGDSKFNRAANTLGTGRTVENYLKARIGGEKKEFLREEKDIIGHIALEFFDETNFRPYVIGVVLQLNEGKLDNPMFYEIKGSALFDELFIDNNQTNSFDELNKVAKANNLDIRPLGSKRDSLKRKKMYVADSLGIDEKYQLLLLKAMSFEPLQEISRFATDFFLEEEKIDLDSIKVALDSYHEISTMVKNEKEKADLLEGIYLLAPKYEEILRKEFALKILGLDAKKEDAIYEKEKHEKDIVVLNDEISNISSLIDLEENNIENIDKQIEAIENDKIYKRLKELKGELNSYQKEYEEVNSRVASWERRMSNESIIATKFGTSLDFSGVQAKKDYSLYLSLLKNYESRIQKIIDEARVIYAEASYKERTLKGKKSDLIDEIARLKKDDYAYPSYVDELIEDIKREVYKRYGVKDFYINPLCSLCEINDPDYRNVIEGILNKRRFDLFIPSSYYPLAKEIFDAKYSDKNYFGVGIVDVNSLVDVKDIPSNSLVNKIEANRVEDDFSKKELKEPTKYLRMLLGDIHIVESVSEFGKNEKYITSNGSYSDGHSIRQIDYSNLKPYIGRETIKLRLIKATKELEEVQAELDELNILITKVTSTMNLQGATKVSSLLEEKNHYNDFNLAKTKVEETTKRIKDLESTNDDFIFMSQKITELENERKVKRSLCSKYENERHLKIEFVGKKKSDIEYLEKEIDNLENTKKLELEDNNIEFKDFSNYLNELRGTLKRKELLSFVGEESRNLNISKSFTTSKIVEHMNNFNLRFPGTMIVDIKNYQEYVKKYSKIKNDELAKLEPELKDSEEKTFQALKEQFLNSLRMNLQRAQSEISLLNRTLKKHPFGSNKEIFVFKANKSSDPLLGEVYRIAMETNQSVAVDNLFTESLDNRSLSTLEDVFKILTSDEDDPKMALRRREIIDYRNYFNYEIEIHINNDENILYYSKNSNSKSGGETQTPFYALIAGAFEMKISEAERSGRSPITLILFDEAFNNMDGERIKQMLEFYNELNIQIMISVPSSRFSYISPFADGIISLAKSGDEVGIYQSFKE